MNVLIINSVPVNGGDEALLESSVELINQKYHNPEINVLCFDPDFCTRNTPGYKFDWDWEYVKQKDKSSRPIRLALKILNKLGIKNFDQYRFSTDKKRVYSKIIQADLIFTSAGGYLHDFYDIEERTSTLKWLIALNKKIIFLPQSIGPFWKNDSRKQMSFILPGIKAVYVREKKSQENIKEIERQYHTKCNSKVTPDIAFYLYKKYPQLFLKKGNLNPKEVLCCFRIWNKEDDLIAGLARKILLLLTDTLDLRVTFLSTCQGIDGYVDDAEFAETICNVLTDVQRSKITICKEHLHPKEYIERAGKFDAYVGMRLHGSILSMLAGTPAFNIAYEDKSTGIYRDIGLEENCLYYNEPAETILEHIQTFIQNLQATTGKLQDILKNQCSQLEELI